MPNPAPGPAAQAAPAEILTETPVGIAAPGARLAGTLIAASDPEVAVLIAAATGVPAAFYRPFARWLAETHRAAVLIWDYRDFAASAATPAQTRRSPATMTDWGIHDAQAARAWLRAELPALPLWLIGHSLGALTVPFQRDPAGIDRLIAVAAGPVDVPDHPWPFRAHAWALWHLAGPLAVAALGYLPGRRLGLGADLPAGVFRQWKRWCTRPASLPGDPDLPGLARPGLRCPVRLVALSDDVMIPARCTWRLAEWLPEAGRIDRVLIDPAAHGLGQVGHIAPFAPRNRALWPAILG
jgi:predicted alpha/beta hydrolase